MTASFVLFVDPTDGPRAQIARALLADACGPQVLVRSAGTLPAASLDGVSEALDELEIPFTPDHASLRDFLDQPPHLLIAVCEEGCPSCPYVPGARSVRRWSLDDPEALTGRARARALRAIRDALEPRIRALAAELRAGRDQWPLPGGPGSG